MASRISTSATKNRHFSACYCVCTLFIIDILLPTASSRPPGAELDISRELQNDGGLDPDPLSSPEFVQGVSKEQADSRAQPHGAQNKLLQEYSGHLHPSFKGNDLTFGDLGHPYRIENDFIPNNIPIHPGRPSTDYREEARLFQLAQDKMDNLGDSPHLPAAPKYMMELYNKFSHDRYSLPMTNIVRSFMNVNEETTEVVLPVFGNKTRVHTLVFNITSIAREEDIYLSELRLYTLVEADRNQFRGVNRRVSVFEIVYETDRGNVTNLISTKDLYGRHSGWETFTVTEAVRRWVRSGLTWNSQILEIRIDSFIGDPDNVQVDFDTRPHNENEPLLVVFSNDKKNRKSETRELHELGLLAHELAMYDVINEEDPEENEIIEDYDEDYYMYDNSYDIEQDYDIQKRDTTSTNRTLSRWKRAARQPPAQLRDPSSKLHNPASNKQRAFMPDVDYYNQHNYDNKARIIKRSNRSRRKRKRGRRRYCRRRPLYVNFKDINWHTWIIAPQGYQAYQCSGRCGFPLSDHLTPTKHAIVQTLVHANYGGVRRRQRAEPACCVPTKLEPMSILYIDDKGIVTYKYDYDDMIVKECGCR